MAEEHGFQAPEGHRLCANDCGFFGSPGTMNLCSKCYRDLHLEEKQDAIVKAAIENKSSSSSSSSSSSASSSSSLKSTVSSVLPAVKSQGSAGDDAAVVERAVQPVVQQAAGPSRCLTCRKRVGLSGFKCRCGSVFCGSHRYPEEHGCAFDYKKAGKEEIAKANPVVKAKKLVKI
ncbi:hypothetical protein Dimus_007017 [Dionaea muscipula]